MGPDAGTPPARFDVRSGDPEYAHDVLRAAYTDFSVRLSGSTEDFVFAHSGVAAGGTALSRMRYSMAVGLDVQPQPGALIVTTRLGGRSLSYTAGRTVVWADLGRPIRMPTGSGWDVEMDDVDVDTLSMDMAAVGRVAQSVSGIAPDRLAFSSMTPVSASAARFWRSAMGHVRDDVLEVDDVASPLLLSEAIRSLATASLATFPNNAIRLMEESGEPEPWAEPAALRRAVAFIDEHAAEDISVADIATAARVGVRALQILFRRNRNRTPLEELRRVRLARAHADLQAADPTRGDTVAAVAARWGFGNPGRFSVHYRLIYGCTPGDTLRA